MSDVYLGDEGRCPQLTLALGRFLRQDMTVHRPVSFQFSASGSFYPLGGGTVSFHLWHDLSPID
jgi:hypothetical protein